MSVKGKFAGAPARRKGWQGAVSDRDPDPESPITGVKGFAKPPNGHDIRVDAHDRQTDVDLEILDLLREGPKSAYRLARALTHVGEEVGLEAMRSRLKALASRGLVVGSASGHPTATDDAEAPLADPWRITEEGRTLVEPEAGVASAPYDREVGAEEEGGRDASFWVLIAIAVVTAVCAAYSLLTATGVLGGT
jgi:DNA-binding PadR family transcriptional regulator